MNERSTPRKPASPITCSGCDATWTGSAAAHCAADASAALTARGWDVHRIAAHTRTTTYTTARIRDRLARAGVIAPPTPTTHLEERSA